MYGFTTTLPMVLEEDPYIPGQYLPEMEAPTAIQDTSVTALKRRGTLLTQMPPISNLSTEKFSNSNWKALEALQYAQAMKIASDETKMYQRRSRAIAKAKGRQAQKIAEG